MHPKLSYWLEKSTKILQYRISNSASELISFYKDELNIRRALISNKEELFPDVSVDTILGHYHILGANSTNSDIGYIGVLSIHKFENRIQATWQLEGSDIQTGFGLLLHNVLSLNFKYEVEGKEFTGLVSYEFVTDTIISGVWTEEGNDEIGVELGRRIPIENNSPLKFFGMN